MNSCVKSGFISEILNKFIEQNGLSERQGEQFALYLKLLQESNKVMNLTAVDESQAVIERHFEDSLALQDSFDLTRISGVVDIGSGAGFPGIPLKIVYPHLHMTLIEVTRKRVVFLEQVIEQLGLTSTSVYPHDWRTFLRKTTIPVDLFVSRASLDVSELLRAFKPSSHYNETLLVYWASQHWVPTLDQERWIIRENAYAIGDMKRKLVFFGNKSIVRT